MHNVETNKYHAIGQVFKCHICWTRLSWGELGFCVYCSSVPSFGVWTQTLL